MKIIGCLIILLSFSCGANRSNNTMSVTLKTLQGEEYNFQQISENTATVLFFLSPECPLCQNYTLNINTLTTGYGTDSIEFIGIVPGNYYTKEEIQGYVEEYHLNIPLLLDPDNTLTNLLGAKITPEVFVLSPQGDVLYSGKIDNWYITLGRNRKKPTEFYLKDALTAITTGKAITVTQTDAVGCYIE